ncbi:MAG: TMEM198/TM7SF3 family protein [Anaerolineales bacterium]|nr:TMEM198/TM7SF3 family protein [Anaerolineales bacterium]
MAFSLLCGAVVALAFAAAVCFAGYRLFLVLLPIWGFVFGFTLGAQAIQAITNGNFLGDVTSWVVGLVVAVIFAVLSYLFYFIAIALFSFSAGYAAGVGFMALIGSQFGLVNFLVGLALGVGVAFVVLRFNVQKWVIIIATSIIGALAMAGIVLFGMPAMSTAVVDLDVVAQALRAYPFMMLLALVAAVGGIVVQYRSTRTFAFKPPADLM